MADVPNTLGKPTVPVFTGFAQLQLLLHDVAKEGLTAADVATVNDLLHHVEEAEKLVQLFPGSIAREIADHQVLPVDAAQMLRTEAAETQAQSHARQSEAIASRTQAAAAETLEVQAAMYNTGQECLATLLAGLETEKVSLAVLRARLEAQKTSAARVTAFLKDEEEKLTQLDTELRADWKARREDMFKRGEEAHAARMSMIEEEIAKLNAELGEGAAKVEARQAILMAEVASRAKAIAAVHAENVKEMEGMGENMLSQIKSCVTTVQKKRWLSLTAHQRMACRLAVITTNNETPQELANQVIRSQFESDCVAELREMFTAMGVFKGEGSDHVA